MRNPIAHIGRAALLASVAAATLGVFGAVAAPSFDMTSINELKQDNKKANKSGELPLPGTPDLSRLDQRLAEQGVAPDAPIMIRVFKAESEMEVWTGDEQGNYKLFATYPICYWSGTLGPKQKEGDKQAPEGFYTVTMEQSIHKGTRWPKSLNVGYPNAFDKVNLRSGSYILIHGGCSSIGCFAMTNKVSEEVFALATRALDAGQSNIPVNVYPFRMTDENLAKYNFPEWRSFWANLKEGYDLFERTHRPPRVTVCGQRYEFAPSSRLQAANPGPLEVCPETAQVIADLSHINKRVAEQPEPATQTSEIKTASLQGPVSYLGGPATAVMGSRNGENFEQQLAPSDGRPGVSETLTRQLACSTALPSCRRYAALRDQVARKVAMKATESERETTSKPKKKKTAKKKRRNRDYSEVQEYRTYRGYRSARYVE
jgi:murein L,D-transpeptidase YafK